MLRTGQNQATLPHLYSNTQQLRLLRNMLVREDGGRVLLGQAIPKPWLDEGKQVRVQRSPTGSGPVSFTIESNVRDGRITARIEPPGRKPPDSVGVRLRHPQDEAIRSMTVDDATISGFSRDWVILLKPKRPTVIEARHR